MELWAQDKRLEALDALNNLARPGQAYLPAMLKYVSFLYEMGHRSDACSLLAELSKLIPDDPRVRDLQSELEQFPTGIRRNALAPIVDHYSMWLEAREPAIKRDITLKAALKQQDFKYINALCQRHDLSRSDRRPVKEQALYSLLASPEQVAAALRSETETALNLLESILDAGGWSDLDDLEQKYGPRVIGEQFRWLPSEETTLGRLEMLGVLFCGRLFGSTHKKRVAVIPQDVREVVASALVLLGRRDAAAPQPNLPGHVVSERARPKHATVQLRLELSGVKPAVWRVLLVPADITLHQLHEVIQVAAGWQDYHLYKYDISGLSYSVPSEEDEWYDIEHIDTRKTLLSSVLYPGLRFKYLYDFGDHWEHVLTVEAVNPVEEPLLYAQCLSGERAFPPEDCGGLSGYRSLMRALDNPGHPEHLELKQWSQGWDPDHFNKTAINKTLERMRYRRKPKHSAPVEQAEAQAEPSQLQGKGENTGAGSVTERIAADGSQLATLLAEVGCNVSIETVRGLTLGCIAASNVVMPGEMLEVLWGADEPVFNSEEHAKRVLGQFFSLWNQIASACRSGQPYRFSPAGKINTMQDAMRYFRMREDEISGFLRGFRLGQDDKDATNTAIRTSIETLEAALEMIRRYRQIAEVYQAYNLAEFGVWDTLSNVDRGVEMAITLILREQMQRRARQMLSGAQPVTSVRVGRNERCPCGSGKKYKHCCGK